MPLAEECDCLCSSLHVAIGHTMMGSTRKDKARSDVVLACQLRSTGRSCILKQQGPPGANVFLFCSQLQIRAILPPIFWQLCEMFPLQRQFELVERRSRSLSVSLEQSNLCVLENIILLTQFATSEINVQRSQRKERRW